MSGLGEAMKIDLRCTVAGLAAGAVALGLDQATKAVATSSAAALSGGIAVFPGFNLVFLRNDGVSFGMFGGVTPWFLIALALTICGWLLTMMVRTRNRTEATGCGLIIGGALGNVIDRLRNGAVTDFLDFHAGGWHWPAFNLADTFIFCGVALLLLAAQREARRNRLRS